MISQKINLGMAKKKVQHQGKRILGNEAYIEHAAMTQDEA